MSDNDKEIIYTCIAISNLAYGLLLKDQAVSFGLYSLLLYYYTDE